MMRELTYLERAKTTLELLERSNNRKAKAGVALLAGIGMILVIGIGIGFAAAQLPDLRACAAFWNATDMPPEARDRALSDLHKPRIEQSR